MPSIRCQKVADLLKKEIGVMLQREIKDPLIGFVTVTDVEVSGDLRSAKVYVSIMGDSPQKQASLRGLERARPFIQNRLGEKVRLRFMPILRFILDESLEYGSRIDALIAQLHPKPEN